MHIMFCYIQVNHSLIRKNKTPSSSCFLPIYKSSSMINYVNRKIFLIASLFGLDFCAVTDTYCIVIPKYYCSRHLVLYRRFGLTYNFSPLSTTHLFLFYRIWADPARCLNTLWWSQYQFQYKLTSDTKPRAIDTLVWPILKTTCL